MSKEVQPFYDKEISCPACTKVYITKKLRSRFVRVERVDTDFFTSYRNEVYNPIFYEVNVCQYCGYSFSDTFSTAFPSGTLGKIKDQISNHWKKQDFGGTRSLQLAINTYKLAILSGKLKEEKNIVLAGLCLRLAWLYRMSENIEQEQRFLQMAVKEYELANMKSEFIGTSLSEMKLLYLIGELHRRLQNNQVAIQFFSKVISHKKRSLEPKTLEMARDQYFITREEGSNENVETMP